MEKKPHASFRGIAIVVDNHRGNTMKNPRFLGFPIPKIVTSNPSRLPKYNQPRKVRTEQPQKQTNRPAIKN